MAPIEVTNLSWAVRQERATNWTTVARSPVSGGSFGLSVWDGCSGWTSELGINEAYGGGEWNGATPVSPRDRLLGTRNPMNRSRLTCETRRPVRSGKILSLGREEREQDHWKYLVSYLLSRVSTSVFSIIRRLSVLGLIGSLHTPTLIHSTAHPTACPRSPIAKLQLHVN